MKLKIGKRKNAKIEVNDPYAEGHDAAKNGAHIHHNPYQPAQDVRAHDLWAQGWKSRFEAQLDEVAARFV